ncbi:hypothetical protein ARMSODRAFT_966509 [Armillaria solidipes]|uniref:Uncharacterized protein n=1 Tax=Armillaria solidipes TaxID=1076256 RepID=A0A2H3AYG4_9AGAR|nr:hypothetical protein ARMSODRAFT_966509 [Armillaria solidipes]
MVVETQQPMYPTLKSRATPAQKCNNLNLELQRKKELRNDSHEDVHQWCEHESTQGQCLFIQENQRRTQSETHKCAT